ncbi:MAG: cupin domain-containing protein [Gammaproteobacteria bacterium]|nr:cupin domain-containing protein [Gammaproteobacteria bacterium]
MANIKVVANPDKLLLNQLDVYNWPVWEKEVSDFPWTYDAEETCYFLQGEVIVIPDGGEAVTMSTGDLVTFPEGMSCRWVISKPVRKHYKFAG